MEDAPDPGVGGYWIFIAFLTSESVAIGSSVAFVTSEDELTKVLKASFVLDPESLLKVRG